VWTGSEYGVSWCDSRNGHAEIYFARIDAIGNKIGSDVRVTYAPETSNRSSLIWRGSGYAVAWFSTLSGYNWEIYFARLDSSGNKISSDIRVTDDPYESWDPSLVWTGSEYGISWFNYQGSSWYVYFARFDSLGNKIGSNIRVTDDPKVSWSPSLVWSGSEYGVSWHDYSDGNEEIYLARLDSYGNKTGIDVRLTSNPAISSYPSLVWTGKQYGVSWQDSRDGNYEIYSARIGCCGNDADMDGYGACFDCNDNDSTVYPEAPEINDGIDNQCLGDPGYGMVDDIEGNSGFNNLSDKTKYSWQAQPNATGYEVARSTYKNFSQNCTKFITSNTYINDSEIPAAGVTFYYLVRATAPNAGSWGQDSSGTERTVSCP
jgi:hypothetical protein